ncbi:MAG: hypothetical protein JRF63_09180, partial [Deltaproteobacteria bacterium]|nr:hypothetical protein [Deltaproteobacteria bacterium]
MQRFIGMTTILLLLTSVGESNADTGAVELRLDIPGPVVRVAQDGQTGVRLPSGGSINRPGQPALQFTMVRLAVPPDADPRTVRVTVEPRDVEQIPGRFDVRAAPPTAEIGSGEIFWGGRAAHIVDGRDTETYGSSDLFPKQWFTGGNGLGAVRRYRFVTVYLFPVRYRPAEGSLVRAAGFDITVTFDSARADPAWSLDDCGSDALAERLLDNFAEARDWYPSECYGPPDGASGLAIITTAELEGESDLLGQYIDMREGQGYQVTVATEAEWDFSTGDDLDSRADRIRLWLQQNVDGLELGWVLLIGNPHPGGNVSNSIPMKNCAGGPTDSYFADISGYWDTSGNGNVCDWDPNLEHPLADGEIDFVPEVYVGRFPVYSDGASAVDDVLAKTMAYEEESLDGDLEWRRRMMLPNSIYFFAGQYGNSTARWDGATVGEWFIRAQLEPRGMVWTTLYEHEGLDTSQFASHFQVDTENTVDQWVRGYGFVFWTGHGSSSGVYRSVWQSDENDNQVPDWQEMPSPEFMATSYLHMLQDAPPAFVVHGSCSNGEPESASNLGYNLLRRGAIGTVSATRAAQTSHFPSADPEVWEKPESWDSDVIDIVVEYTVNLLDGAESGRALGDALALTGNGNDSSWYQK